MKRILLLTNLMLALLLGACASTGGNRSAPAIDSESKPTSIRESREGARNSGITLHADPLLPSQGSRYTNTQANNDSQGLSAITERQTASSTVMPLLPPADLWERIRRGYAMPVLDNDLVRDREQWYTSRQDYIGRMGERSRKYLFHIVEELEVRNMPTELALLPFVESAFNPQAVSTVKAAGMWQFMPATGKYFELKQNAFRDDRRDVLASTRAALDYLQKLYRMFGDWHLALAAYNWGEGNVSKAISRNKHAGRGTGYSDIAMPMETRLYVPKLQAMANIIGNPGNFNSRLPTIENHPYFQTVTLRRDIDVALAAKLADVPLDDFKALNPSLSRPLIMAAGTPQILLPWDNAETFQANLEGYSGGRLASWTVWIAPTTMRPADAAKRLNMAENELRNVNNIPPKVVIRAGSTLLVPRAAHVEEDITLRVADTGQMSWAPEVVQKRTLVKAGRKETVASIASRYKISKDNVAQWNNVAPHAAFKAGQQVVLFLAVNASPSSKPAKAVPTRRTATVRMTPHKRHKK